MEASGAVCLPAAGYRNGYDGDASVNYVGGGYYWSATPFDSSKAYYLNSGSGSVNPAHHRYCAQSIRLVTEYQSEPSAE